MVYMVRESTSRPSPSMLSTSDEKETCSTRCSHTVLQAAAPYTRGLQPRVLQAVAEAAASRVGGCSTMQ